MTFGVWFLVTSYVAHFLLACQWSLCLAIILFLWLPWYFEVGLAAMLRYFTLQLIVFSSNYLIAIKHYLYLCRATFSHFFSYILFPYTQHWREWCMWASEHESGWTIPAKNREWCMNASERECEGILPAIVGCSRMAHARARCLRCLARWSFCLFSRYGHAAVCDIRRATCGVWRVACVFGQLQSTLCVFFGSLLSMLDVVLRHLLSMRINGSYLK